MRKFINWASILFVVCFVYAFIANYFDKVPYFPFGEFDIFPTLGVIASAIAAKDFLNYEWINYFNDVNLEIDNLINTKELPDARISELLEEKNRIRNVL